MDEDDNRYVPRNMPAIGDLMEMFDFGDRDDRDIRKDIDGLLDRILDDRHG
jgi:phospholipase C